MQLVAKSPNSIELFISVSQYLCLITIVLAFISLHSYLVFNLYLKYSEIRAGAGAVDGKLSFFFQIVHLCGTLYHLCECVL